MKLRHRLEHVLGVDEARAKEEARSLIRSRLTERPLINEADALGAAVMMSTHRVSAVKLLHTLADVLGVPSGALRSEDLMSDLMSAQLADLSETSRAVLEGHGMRDRVDVFTDDIVFALERKRDRDSWNRQARSLPTPPRNEDDWADLILTMTVARFILFFAPSLKT